MNTPPLRPIRSASVLLPTWQGLEFLERVLDALAGQRCAIPWDLFVIDSGSTDGTWERLQVRRASFPVPFRADRIHPVEFDHGDTRNRLAARSTGDLLVYLSQDAIPSTPEWLSLLLRNFADPAVGAAYCRNVPRADARLLSKVFCRSDPGYSPTRFEARMPDPATWSRMSVDDRRQLLNFNNVASAIRRELWERHPFPRTMMGEDVLMGRAILEAGYTVVYDVEATVDHSHDYGPEKMRWRGHVDGRFNAEWMQRICVGSERDADVLTERMLAEDTRVLERLGIPPEEIARSSHEARELRTALVSGLYEGGLSPRRYPRTALRDRTDLRVLLVAYVTHAKGPSGAGVGPGYQQLARSLGARGPRQLARSLGARGHRVCLLVVSEAEAGARLRLERDEYEGVKIVRAWEPAASVELADAFRDLLAGEQPELVHFLEVRDSTLALIHAAGGLGLPIVASLDDHDAFGDIGDVLGKLGPTVAPDLWLCSSLELRKAWLDAGYVDPQTIAFRERGAPAAGAGPPPDEATELEFRYRALCCVVRPGDDSPPLFEAPGAAASATGETTRQGVDWLLLRPHSAAEYGIAGVPAGPVVLQLEQYALAAEPTVVLSGCVRVDGVEVGRFAPKRGSERDAPVLQTVAFRLAEGARVLRLEPGLLDGAWRAEGEAAADGAAEAHLRVCRVTLMRPRAADARRARPRADLAGLAEELRVTPGPPIDLRTLPKLAIVVPSLDGGNVLPDCLASIAALEYERERLEVVLVDNGSTDGSVDFVRQHFPSVRILSHDRNLGFAAACNAGARAARDADVVAFLNNDMRFEPDFLVQLVAPLVRRECAMTTAKLLSWDGQAIDTSGTGTTLLGIAVQPGYGQPPRPEHDVPRRTLFGCGGAMAVRAAVLQDAGGFDEEYFAYYEDLDLGWRMWVLGHEVHYVPTAVGYHHHSHTSKRFPPEVVRLVMIRNSLLTCIKNYDDANLARILPAMLALAIRRAHLKSGLDEGPFRIEAARPTRPNVATRFLAAVNDGDRTVPIERTGAADLIAIDDVLSDWEHWMRRRREVQERRRRGDDEIQRLFLDPLACVEGDDAYAALQAGLFQLYGLDRAFGRS